MTSAFSNAALPSATLPAPVRAMPSRLSAFRFEGACRSTCSRIVTAEANWRCSTRATAQSYGAVVLVQEGGSVAAYTRGERIARPTANAPKVKTRGDAMRRAVETRVRTGGLY